MAGRWLEVLKGVATPRQPAILAVLSAMPENQIEVRLCCHTPWRGQRTKADVFNAFSIALPQRYRHPDVHALAEVANAVVINWDRQFHCVAAYVARIFKGARPG